MPSCRLSLPDSAQNGQELVVLPWAMPLPVEAHPSRWHWSVAQWATCLILLCQGVHFVPCECIFFTTIFTLFCTLLQPEVTEGGREVSVELGCGAQQKFGSAKFPDHAHSNCRVARDRRHRAPASPPPLPRLSRQVARRHRELPGTLIRQWIHYCL